MTAILGIFTADGDPTDEALVTRMLSRMSSRGGARAAIWSESGAAIAVARHEWEFGPGFSGPVLIVHDGDLVVAADASIYYKADLRRKISDKGVRPKGDTPSHLVLAAYRAFGDKCPEVLEGDFSFVIWDRKARRVLAARDFGGKRWLHYATLQSGRTLVIASSIAAILEHPECPSELNLFAIGCIASNLRSAHHQTSYKAIDVVASGYTLLAEGRSVISVELRKHWTPPPFEMGSGLSFDAAAEELRELLCQATAERLDQVGTTSITMSGGADSPAVFACGQNVLREARDGRRLLPVSMSYPTGDRGREDELITAIAEHWQTPILWIDSRTIPIFEQPEHRATERDEPFAHAFEMWNRALFAGCREVGARIALDGYGGDQLFYVSNYYLADLLQAGSLRTLRTQWRMKPLHGVKNFWGLAVEPLIPRSIRGAARHLGLGKLVETPFERRLPGWVDRQFAARHELLEKELKGTPSRGAETCSAFEARWFLTHPYFPRLTSLLGQLGLENGVETRSPLYDQRVISFAATRPRSDKNSGRRTKRLLGRAMQDLLPAHVLAPRPFKTGLVGGFLERGLIDGMSSLSAHAFDKSCRLAALGAVNIAMLRSAVTEYERSRDSRIGIALFLTLQTELWLRARDSSKQRAGRHASVTRLIVQADATNAA
jgi:asparagine synthase (glutamine-hydrolysing)